MKKIIITVLAIVAILGTMWAAANSHHLAAFPSILPSYYAKEFCSCHFVLGRDEEFCHRLARQWLPEKEFQLDKEKGLVVVSAVFLGFERQHQAKYIGKRYGCVLE